MTALKKTWVANEAGHVAEHNEISNRLFDVRDYASVQAAVTAIGANGGQLYIPAGAWDISELTPPEKGISIVGDFPTLEYVEGVPPGLDLRPNGGTWLDCGGGVGMIGENIRGLHLKNLGFKNFSTMMTFGGDNAEGASLSDLTNIVGVGNTAVNSSDIGIQNYNFEFFSTSRVRLYKVNTGLRLIVQNNYDQPGNSIHNDFYVYTYAKSAANGNNTKAGIEILGMVPTVGPTMPAIDLMTFIRPQVNSFSGDGTGYGIKLVGIEAAKVYEINMIDVDVEGPLAAMLYLEYVYDSRFSIATCPATGPIVLEAHVADCIFESFNPGVIVTNGSTYRNMFIGFFDSISANKKGLITDTDTGLLKLFTNDISAVSLAEYNDNAAALAGGLVAGDFYRTGDALKVVHA